MLDRLCAPYHTCKCSQSRWVDAANPCYLWYTILRRMPESYWQNPRLQPAVSQYPCACPWQYQRIMAYFSVSHLKSHSSDFHCHNWLALWKFGRIAPRFFPCIVGESVDEKRWCWIDKWFIKVFINVNFNSFSLTNYNK